MLLFSDDAQGAHDFRKLIRPARDILAEFDPISGDLNGALGPFVMAERL